MNKFQKNLLLIIVSFFILSCFVSGVSFAKEKKYVGKYSTLLKAKGRTMKHFDIDDDGYLNRYENSLYNTHKIFGYPLAKKKKQKPYDFNGDLMLQPFEMTMYLKDKKNGTLKRYSKKKKRDSGVRQSLGL